jgi:GST-like protein
VDSDGPGGGRYTMMESGAILIYLAEKTGRFLSADPRQRYDALQWLFFQVAHVGPMFGQANHFNHLEQAIPYARDRYNNESLRIFRVIENRLSESAWLGGDNYSIADMAVFPWCYSYEKRGVEAEQFPYFKRWWDAMEARPAVRRTLAMSEEIFARMKKAAEGKPPINLYDNRQSAERLAQSASVRK